MTNPSPGQALHRRVVAAQGAFTTTSRRPGALAHLVPNAALTLVVIGGHRQTGSWTVVMQELAALASRRSEEDPKLLYVACAERAPEPPGTLTGFTLVSDLDEEEPGLGGGCIPTLANVRAALPALGSDEDRHVVILDDFCNAKPYWFASVGDLEEHLPIPIESRLSEREADHWRAKDLAAFAAGRAHAPTIVVTEHHDDFLSSIACMQGVAALTVVSLTTPQGHELLTLRASRPGQRRCDSDTPAFGLTCGGPSE